MSFCNQRRHDALGLTKNRQNSKIFSVESLSKGKFKMAETVRSDERMRTHSYRE